MKRLRSVKHSHKFREANENERSKNKKRESI